MSVPSGAADTITAHTNLAGVLLGAGKLDEAEREILAALQISPRYAAARRQLFELRVRQERTDEAFVVAEDLLRDPEAADNGFLVRLAELYRDSGRTAEGVSRFRMGYDSGRIELGVPLSRLLWKSGDLAGADRVAHAVLARDPANQAAMASASRRKSCRS